VSLKLLVSIILSLWVLQTHALRMNVDSISQASLNGRFLESKMDAVSSDIRSFLLSEEFQKKNALEHLLNVFHAQGFQFLAVGQESFVSPKGKGSSFQFSRDENKNKNLSVIYNVMAKGLLCPIELLSQFKNNIASNSEIEALIESRKCLAVFNVGRRASTSRFDLTNKFLRSFNGVALKVYAVEAYKSLNS